MVLKVSEHSITRRWKHQKFYEWDKRQKTFDSLSNTKTTVFSTLEQIVPDKVHHNPHCFIYFIGSVRAVGTFD